jgi:hypothetical protein
VPPACRRDRPRAAAARGPAGQGPASPPARSPRPDRTARTSTRTGWTPPDLLRPAPPAAPEPRHGARGRGPTRPGRGSLPRRRGPAGAAGRSPGHLHHRPLEAGPHPRLGARHEQHDRRRGPGAQAPDRRLPHPVLHRRAGARLRAGRRGGAGHGAASPALHRRQHARRSAPADPGDHTHRGRAGGPPGALAPGLPHEGVAGLVRARAARCPAPVGGDQRRPRGAPRRCPVDSPDAGARVESVAPARRHLRPQQPVGGGGLAGLRADPPAGASGGPRRQPS